MPNGHREKKRWWSSQHGRFVLVATKMTVPPFSFYLRATVVFTHWEQLFFFFSPLHLQSTRVKGQPPWLMVPSSAALTHHQNHQARASLPFRYTCWDLWFESGAQLMGANAWRRSTELAEDQHSCVRHRSPFVCSHTRNIKFILCHKYKKSCCL